MATPEEQARIKKYTAALARVKKAQPEVHAEVVQKFVAAGFSYTGLVPASVQKIADPNDRKIVIEFMQDRATIEKLLKDFVGKTSEGFASGFGNLLGEGAKKAAEKAPGFGDAIAKGLGSGLTSGVPGMVNSALFQIYKMGASAVVVLVAVVLFVVGIVILLRAPLSKAVKVVT